MALADPNMSFTSPALPKKHRGFSLIESKVGSVGPSATLTNKQGFSSTRNGSSTFAMQSEDTTPVFTVKLGQKIPPKDEHRTPGSQSARMGDLMRAPAHRPSASKYDFDPVNRTLVPFTQEDIDQFGNLPLINTLREPMRFTGPPKTTVTQPPGFYDDDMAKWDKKFEKSLADRKAYKRFAMSNTTFNVLNTNENIKSTFDMDKTLQATNYTGG